MKKTLIFLVICLITGVVVSCRDDSAILSPVNKKSQTVWLKVSPDTLVVSSVKPSPREPDPTTTIEFSLPVDAYVRLVVFDDFNQLVAVLIDQELPAGIHMVTWPVENLATGVYYFRLSAGSFVQIRPFLLVK